MRTVRTRSFVRLFYGLAFHGWSRAGSSERRRKYRPRPSGHCLVATRWRRLTPGSTRSARPCGVGNKTVRYDHPDVLRSAGETYRPTAVGRRRSNGEWEGWIEVVDAVGVERVATDVETTQSDADAFRYWADGIGVAYAPGS